MQGAGGCAIAAANAGLFVDEIDAFRILRDGFMGACLGALAALYAYGRHRFAVLLNNLDTRFIFIELFVKRARAFENAAEAVHAFNAFNASQSLHGLSLSLKQMVCVGGAEVRLSASHKKTVTEGKAQMKTYE